MITMQDWYCTGTEPTHTHTAVTQVLLINISHDYNAGLTL